MAQRGSTLIEQLIAMLVLSIGLLGVAGLQLTGLKNTGSAYYRSQAAIYTHEMLDRLRANYQAAIDGNYDITLKALSDLTQPSTGASVAAVDTYDWLRNLDSVVPGAKGAIDCDANSVCLVTVQWDDSRAEGSNSTKTHQLAARL